MFKNILAFEMTSRATVDFMRSDELVEMVGDCPSIEPAASQWRRFGFAHLGIFGEEPVFTGASGSRLFCVRCQERVVPGAVIKRELDARVSSLQQKESRVLSRREIAQLKDDVVANLLTRAFVRPTDVLVMVTGSWLLLNTASVKMAEEVLSFLRIAVDAFADMNGLEYTPINLIPLNGGRTRPWLREIALGDAEGEAIVHNEQLDDLDELIRFSHLNNAVLKGEGLVRLKDVEFDSEQGAAALQAAREVQEVGVAWTDRAGSTALQFNLTNHLAIKGVKSSEIFATASEQHSAASEGADVARLDTDLAIFAPLFLSLVESIKEAVADPEDNTDEASTAFDKALSQLTRAADSLSEADDYADIFYDDAVHLTRKLGRCSISRIQRDFRIGYNRAARLVELMEERGIVGPAEENGLRIVLETEENPLEGFTITNARPVEQNTQIDEDDEL